MVQHISLFEGMVTNYVCLRNVDLRAKLVSLSSEAVFAPSLGTFSTNLEWAFVAKGGKQVPLPNIFLPSSPSIEVL